MSAFFSIVIPLYNKANFIKKTLDSVFNQIFTDYEIIVINDGSTDNSLEVISEIKDKRLHIFTTKNQGVSAARNFGISKSQTNYIAFLDADDIWKPNHLQNLKTLIEQFPQAGLYACAYEKKHKNITVKSIYNNIPKHNWSGIVTDYFASSTRNAIAWTSAVAIPRNTLKTVGYFNENITLGAGEDTDLWIRIAVQFPVAFDNRASAIHNLETENRISNSNTNVRQFMNLDAYEDIAKSNSSLKKYLDINRFSIGLQYKLANNSEKTETYWNALDKNNLNSKQRLLMKCPRNILIILIKFQNALRGLKINWSPF